MNTDDVQMFIEVADIGGVALAADRLGISKSMVSRGLVRLESALGSQLLERTTRGVTLTEAGTTFYDYAVTFDTELTVKEVVQIAPNWAFVRTSSNGHVTVNAIKQRVPDANHELFIFQKGDAGAWKIARYSFATTNPRP